MSPKLKKVVALAIACLPGTGLRRALYQACLGYDIHRGARLGWGVVIAVDQFRCADQVVVRRGTVFMGPIRVELKAGAFIGKRNTIECGDGAAHPSQAHMGYTRTFVMGHQALINEGHRFDVFGTVVIGDGSWVAGFDSQFLTHGAGTMDRDILIGERCFIGSAVRFAPGAGVGNECVVGMGAVVTKRWPEDRVVVAGVPAKVIKVRTADDGYQFQRHW